MPTASERITDARQAARVEKYREVCERFGVDLQDNYSGAEDAQAILDGEEPCEAWCLVTVGGSYIYAYATDGSLEAAQAHAVEYIGDTTYEEAPLAIVNLDDGAEYQPDWSSITWKLAPR